MQSITNELMHQERRGRPLNTIKFVWSVRNKSVIEAMAMDDLPSRLPPQFQPDLLADTQHTSSKVLH